MSQPKGSEPKSVKCIVDSQGYCILRDQPEGQWWPRLTKRLEHFARHYPGRKALLPDPVFVEFATAGFMRVLAKTLLGPNPVVHHVCGRLLVQGTEKPWHHDRDGDMPRANAGMYHVMVYPKGLPRTVAPLVIMPGTHLTAVRRDAPRELVSLAPPAQPVSVWSDEPLVVVLDSALWHMRPAAPAFEPRFDLNVSYCTLSGPWTERDTYTAILKQSAAHSAYPEWFRTH